MYNYKVSVLILTYNHAAFIRETLASIEDQNFDSIQVVIGDDCSSDGTRELIDRLSLTSRLNYVKIYQENNKGITGNFNDCLRACEGKYIFLLGGDDMFLPGKVFRQYTFMEENPELFLTCHDADVYDSISATSIGLYSNLFRTDDLTLTALVLSGTYFSGCTVAIRNAGDLPLCDSRIKYASDWLWYVDILAKYGGRVGYLHEVLSRYRRHGDNVTSSAMIEQAYEETISSLNIMLEKYPFLFEVGNRAKAEREFAFGLKGIFLGKLFWGLKRMVRSFSLSPFGFYFFIKYRFNSIALRTKMLYFTRGQ